MMADAQQKSWDRMKIVCRQPYANGKQFGLSFVAVKTSSNNCQEKREVQEKNNNQTKLNNMFGVLENDR